MPKCIVNITKNYTLPNGDKNCKVPLSASNLTLFKKYSVKGYRFFYFFGLKNPLSW